MVVENVVVTTILTSKDDGTIVKYPYPNGNSYVNHEGGVIRNAADRRIDINVKQPKGATRFGSTCRVQTKECGWPIPDQSYDHTKGGQIQLEALGSVLKYPNTQTFYSTMFSEVFAYQCN